MTERKTCPVRELSPYFQAYYILAYYSGMRAAGISGSGRITDFFGKPIFNPDLYLTGWIEQYKTEADELYITLVSNYSDEPVIPLAIIKELSGHVEGQEVKNQTRVLEDVRTLAQIGPNSIIWEDKLAEFRLQWGQDD